LTDILEEAGARRAKLVRQVAMAGEFISILNDRMG